MRLGLIILCAMKISTPAALEPMPFYSQMARRTFPAFLAVGGLWIFGLLVWQGVTSGGNPNPIAENTSRYAAMFDIAALVFREGLECVLVLAAIMAGMVGENGVYRRPIVLGVGLGMLATILTWFVAVGILSNLGESVSALNLQAATGLLAIVVLLVIMNWFFHKIYWGGWIGLHTRRKKQLIKSAAGTEGSKAALWSGLALLGFSSLYREGFEIVLFLQTYNLRLGGAVTLSGAAIGLALVGTIATLTFLLEKKLPYRKMLEMTGILLGAVLLVMVGEQAQEMQLAGWIPTTPLTWLEPLTPAWLGMWFAIFPTAETLSGQVLAAVLVIGSFFFARKMRGGEGVAPAPLPATRQIL